MILYWGVVKNGTFLLSSFHCGEKPEEARKEAQRCANGWALHFVNDKIDVVPLSKRDKTGWEIART